MRQRIRKAISHDENSGALEIHKEGREGKKRDGERKKRRVTRNERIQLDSPTTKYEERKKMRNCQKKMPRRRK